MANVAAHLSGSGANNPTPSAADAPPAPAAPDNSYANDFGSGLHSLETGVRATARLAGNAAPDWMPGKQSLEDFGGAAPVTAAPAGNYQDASRRLASDLRGGNYSQALSDAPHAALQAVPSTLGTIGAGMIGGAVGNAPGAAAGIAAFTGATQAGDNVAARAVNNGRTLDTASTGDIAGGLATTGLQAGLNVVGLRPGMVPGIGSALAKAGPVIRAGADVGADALAGGVGSVAQQAGTSIGTDQGLAVDPYAAEAAAATAAAARAGTIGGRVVKGAGTGAVDAINSAGVTRPTDEATAQRDLAVHSAITARKDSDGGSYTDAAQALRTQQAANMTQVGRALADGMTPEDAAAFRSTYGALLAQAGSPNQSFGPAALDALQAYGLPPDVQQRVGDGLMSLDALSAASRPSTSVGPAQKVLGGLGKVGGVIAGAHLGGVQGALDGILGSSLSGQVGSAIGAGADKALGLSEAPAVTRARLAAGYLNRQGVVPATAADPVAASSDLLASVRSSPTPGILPPDTGAPVMVPATDNSPAAMLTPAQMDRGLRLNEAAANALQGSIYKRNVAVQAARDAGVVSAPALAAAAGPSALWQATNGMAGSPALPSDPLMQPALPGAAPMPQTASQAVAPSPAPGLGQRGVGLSMAARDAQMRAQAANAAPGTPALRQAIAASAQPAPTSAGVLGGGLQAYILRAAQSRGANPTGHDVNAAVDDLVQTDKLDPRIGDLIKSGANVPVNSPEAQAVLSQTFHRVGLGAHLMNGSQPVDPNAPMPSAQPRPTGLPPARMPIQDITRWMAAREDAKQHVQQVAATAIASGLPGAVPVIQAIGAVKAEADKERLRTEYLATLTGKEAATAKALLSSPSLMRGI